MILVALLPAAPSAAVPQMQLSPIDRLNPILLSMSEGRSTGVLVLTDEDVTGVTVTFSGAGLTFDPAVVDLGNIDAVDGKRAYTEITATTGGMHTVHVTMDANETGGYEFDIFAWTPGGAPIPATGDLSGRHYGNVDLYTSNGGNSYEDRQMLSFLDDELAFIGPPGKGRPTCTTGSETKTKGCVRYRYDTANQIVQIGGAIGRAIPSSVAVEGIGRADDGEGELFNRRTFSQRIKYPGPGNTYGGSWRFSYSQFLDVGLATVKLTLTKKGTFTLRYGYGDDDGKITTRTGTYSLTAPGRLRLQGKFGTELHTFALRTDKNGKVKPSQGIWFTFGQGKHVSAVPMKPGK